MRKQRTWKCLGCLLISRILPISVKAKMIGGTVALSVPYKEKSKVVLLKEVYWSESHGVRLGIRI